MLGIIFASNEPLFINKIIRDTIRRLQKEDLDEELAKNRGIKRKTGEKEDEELLTKLGIAEKQSSAIMVGQIFADDHIPPVLWKASGQLS